MRYEYVICLYALHTLGSFHYFSQLLSALAYNAHTVLLYRFLLSNLLF